MRSYRLRLVGIGVLCLILAPLARAGAPTPATAKAGPSEAMRAALVLTARIDQQVAAHWADKGVRPAPLAGDAEFLRRVYLDVAGRIPRVAEARDFLDDNTPDKRLLLIDRLLEKESHYYVRHFSSV